MEDEEQIEVYLLLERAKVGLREAALQVRVGHHHQPVEPHQIKSNQIKSKPRRLFPSESRIETETISLSGRVRPEWQHHSSSASRVVEMGGAQRQLRGERKGRMEERWFKIKDAMDDD